MTDQKAAMYRLAPNNFDAVVMSDNSAFDIGSAAQSKKDESISSKLDQLIQCDRSIKQRMEEFDQRFVKNGTNSRLSGIDQKKNSLPNSESDNTILKMPSYRQSYLKPKGINAEQNSARQRVGHYPNYLEPAITSSSYAKNALFKKTADTPGSTSSKKLAMKVPEYDEKKYLRSQNPNRRDTKGGASDSQPEFRKQHFSCFNHVTPEKFMPKIVNMKIDGNTKSIELLAECRTGDYSTALSKRSFKQTRCESAGSIKGTRKSLQSASFTTSTLKKNDAPKLSSIIKSITNSNEFKSTHFENAQSMFNVKHRFSRLFSRYEV